MWRPAAWHRKKTDFRLVSITASQSSSVKSTESARRMMPALLTRMSSRPSFSSVSSTRRWTGSMVERSAETISARRPRARTFVDGFLGGRPADRGDVGAGGCQGEGDRLADAGIGAGDDGDLAGEVERVGHLHFSPSRLREGSGVGARYQRAQHWGRTRPPAPSRKREEINRAGRYRARSCRYNPGSRRPWPR